MRAQQVRGRPAHRAGVEPLPVMPGVPAGEHVADRAVADDVAIALFYGVANRVEARRHRGGLKDGDIAGQKGIQGSLEHLGREGGGRLKGGRLAERVNARIRPPASGHPARLAGNRRQGALELALDGSPARLDLPAGVVGPFVGEGQKDLHRLCLKPRHWRWKCPRQCSGTAATQPPHKGQATPYYIALCGDGSTRRAKNRPLPRTLRQGPNEFKRRERRARQAALLTWPGRVLPPPWGQSRRRLLPERRASA